MSTLPSKNKLPELNALRGIAILMVVLFHFSMPAIRDDNSFPLKYGITGVHLFFMLSGFLILMSISYVKNSIAFIRNRFIRLYPAYWICLSFTLLLYCYNWFFVNNEAPPMELFKEYGFNLTMIQSYFKIRNLDDPYWSLTVELLFYLLVLFIYAIKQLKKVEIILFSLVLARCLLLIVRYFHPYNVHLKNFDELDRYLPLINYLPLFLIGAVFYKMLTEKATILKILMILVCYLAQIMEYPHMGALGAFHVTQFDFAVIVFLFIAMFSLFVLQYLTIIVNPVLLFFGRISYALYLFHQYFCLLFLMPLLETKLHMPHSFSMVLAFAAAITVAYLTTVYLDEPIRRKLKKPR